MAHEFSALSTVLIVADKTAAFLGLNTVLIDVFSLVTFRTVVHFHAIPGVSFKAGNIIAPDIAAITADQIGLIRFQFFRLTDIPMTGDTVHFTHFDMCDVRKKDAIGLPGIDQPGYFSALFDILRDKLCLLRTFAIHLFVTVNTLGQLRNSRKGAIFTEKMAAFTAVIYQFVVLCMIVMNRLLLGGVKQLRENNPADNKAGGQTQNEKQRNGSCGTVAGF